MVSPARLIRSASCSVCPASGFARSSARLWSSSATVTVPTACGPTRADTAQISTDQQSPSRQRRAYRCAGVLADHSRSWTSRLSGNGGCGMNDLVDTTEMYLRTIYDLEEEGVTPLRARIAERLDQSGPTVSQTVSRMERDGLLHVAGDRHLELTDKGRALAVSVMRKHRLAERLLVDVIGLPWEEVHAEACRWEHVMSEDVERRLVQVLNNPTTSPFGNPIPGLSELGVGDDLARDQINLVRLTELPSGMPVAVVVRQLTEHVQGDTELIAKLKDAGVVPNARVTVEANDRGGVMIVIPGHEQVELPHHMAHAVKVEKV